MAPSGKRIALVMQNWYNYIYGVQIGIAEYVLHQPHWTWARFVPTSEHMSNLSDSRFDGVIAYVEDGYLPQLKSLKIPVVSISNWEHSPFPQVLPDDHAIGRMAAQYLLELGVKHFGFVGIPHAVFSNERGNGFMAGLAAESMQAKRLYAPGGKSKPPTEVSPGNNALTLNWLRSLPRPAGVFAAIDMAAVEILEVCRHSNIRVPEDICVLGVDNDELVHRFSFPPLSSIAIPTERIGLEAVKLLETLMAGRKPASERVLVPPVGVIGRQSTNLLTADDEDVVAAVRYMRDNVRDRVSVSAVLKHVAISRRRLERKFAQSFGRTPFQEIQRVRLEKAKQLLSQTDMSMPAIAARSGFTSAQHLARVFHALTALTPTQYRKQF
jgi:LacI family transcriptional regulator